MPNTNCLEGIRCPKCGSDKRFNIAVTVWAEFTDNGSETYGDNEHDENSAIQCCECDHAATVYDFTREMVEAFDAGKFDNILAEKFQAKLIEIKKLTVASTEI